MNNLITFLNKKDILHYISDLYYDIDVVSRRSFWIIFGILCFAFGFHTICFMWGNHDWAFVETSLLPWDGRTFEGRYTVYLFKKLFFKSAYLPLIYDVITFIVLALNAVLICNYWKLEKRIAYFVLCGLILTAQPFTLSMLYYIHMGPEAFIGMTFVLTALIISEKYTSDVRIYFHHWFYYLLAIILINMALATYPVLLNTIAVAFFGRLLIQSFSWKGTLKDFKSHFLPFIPTLINIVCGIFSYKIFISYVFVMKDQYNTATLPLNKLPEHLFTSLRESIRQLYDYNFPFISQGVLLIFFALLLLLYVYICCIGNKRQKTLRLFLLFASLFATHIVMIISYYYIVRPRIELFGFVCFQTLIAVCVFNEFKRLRNFSILLLGFATFIFIINDLDCLRVWKLGFDAEQMRWNRMIIRLENNPQFKLQKKYNIVIIGERFKDALRQKYFNGKQKMISEGLLQFSYNLHPLESLAFYYPVNFISQYFSPEMQDKKAYYEQLKRLYDAGILDKAKAWPDENGLIVWDDIILYVTDEKILEDYKKQLQEEYGVKNAD